MDGKGSRAILLSGISGYLAGCVHASGGYCGMPGMGVVGMYGYGLLPFTVGVMLLSIGVADGGNFFISLAFTRILGLAGVASFDKLRMIRQVQGDSTGLGWFGRFGVIAGVVLRWWGGDM